MARDVFISHSSKDKAAADAICHSLESSGLKCWIAPRDVNPGAEYAEEIANGIESCKIFLLIFSGESNTSKPVSREIESAFRYEKTVVPFRIEDVEMRKSLEYYLSNLHWLDARPDDKDFCELVRVVKRVAGSPAVSEPVPEAPPAPAFCVQCGFQLNAGARFCQKCGVNLTPQEQPSAPEPICPGCGKAYDPAEDLFCLECGTKLG